MDHLQHRFLVGVLTALSVPVTAIVTVTLIILILTSAQLRQSVRHLIYVSLSVADLIVGLLCSTYVSIYMLSEKPNFNKANCLAGLVTGAYLGTVSLFVTFWSLVLLHVLFIVRHGMQLLHISPMKLSPVAEVALRVVLALLPWLLMLALIPGLLGHFAQRKYLTIPYSVPQVHELCFRLEMKRWIWLLFHSLCMYMPVCLAALLCVVSGVVFVLRRRNIRTDSTGLLDEPATDLEHPGVLITGTLVSIALNMPINVALMTWHLLEVDDIEQIFNAFLYLRLLNFSKSFVLPAVWFADKAVRERVHDVLPEWFRAKFPCCRHGNADADGVTVTYQDLVENESAGTESRVV